MLSTRQVADTFCVRPKTVSRWITQGVLHGGKRYQLAAQRAGKCWRVQDGDLKCFITAISSALKASSVTLSASAEKLAGERAEARLAKKMAPRRRKP